MDIKIALKTEEFEFRIIDNYRRDFEYVEKIGNVEFHHYLRASGHHNYLFCFHNLVFITEYLTNKVWQVKLDDRKTWLGSYVFAVKRDDVFTFLSENPDYLSGNTALKMIKETQKIESVKTKHKKVIDIFIEKINDFYKECFVDLFSKINDLDSVDISLNQYFQDYLEERYEYPHFYDNYSDSELVFITKNDAYIDATENCKRSIKYRLENVIKYQDNPKEFCKNFSDPENYFLMVREILIKKGCDSMNENNLRLIINSRLKDELEMFDPFFFDSPTSFVKWLCNDIVCEIITAINDTLFANVIEHTVESWIANKPIEKKEILSRVLMDYVKNNSSFCISQEKVMSRASIENKIIVKAKKFFDLYKFALPFFDENMSAILELKKDKVKLFDDFMNGDISDLPDNLKDELFFYIMVITNYKDFMYKKNGNLKPWTKNVKPMCDYFENIYNSFVKYQVVVENKGLFETKNVLRNESLTADIMNAGKDLI